MIDGAITMKTSKTRHFAVVAALAASAMAQAALVSCTDTLGIFASVASETDNSAEKTAAIEYSSPAYVVRLGTTYYAGIGRIWEKAAADTQWSYASVSGISGLEDGSLPFSGSAAVVESGGNDTLFAAISDSVTGAALGVWATTDGSSWTRTDSAFPPSGESLVRLMAANGTLFAATTNTRSSTDDTAVYSIYYLSGSTFTPTNVADDESLGVPSGAAWDGSAYWISAGDVLLRGGLSSLVALTNPSGGSSYSGLAAKGTEIVAATRTGYLHRTDDGGSTWLSAGPFDDSDGDVYSLSAPLFIDFGDSTVIVAGTDSIARSSSDTPPSDGYLEFDLTSGFASDLEPDSDHTLISTSVDFDSSLTTRSVGSMSLFELDDGTMRLFALTDAYGLWSKTWDGDAWGNWQRE